MTRDPITDPRPGDRIEALDGGTIYVYDRQGQMIWISRQPYGPAQRRIRVTTLAKMAKLAKEEDAQ